MWKDSVQRTVIILNWNSGILTLWSVLEPQH